MAPVPAAVLASAFLSAQTTVLSLFAPLPDLPVHPAVGLTLEHLPTGWTRYGGAMGWGWNHLFAVALGGFRGKIPVPAPDRSGGFWESSGLTLALTWHPWPWMAVTGRGIETRTESGGKRDGQVGFRVVRPRWHAGLWVGEGGRERGMEAWILDGLDTWWGWGWQRNSVKEYISLAVRWDLSPVQIIGGVVLEEGPLQTTVYGTVGIQWARGSISTSMAYQTHPYLDARWAVSAEAGGSP